MGTRSRPLFGPARLAVVIRMAEIDAAHLIQDHAQEIVREWVEFGKTHSEIAARFLPELSESNGVAVVEKAMARLLTPEERRPVADDRARKNLMDWRERDPEGWHERGLKGARARYERHGFDPAALIKGSGNIPRSEGERSRTIELLLDPACQHRGKRAGRPNYALIARVINAEEFGGIPVRGSDSIRNFHLALMAKA